MEMTFKNFINSEIEATENAIVETKHRNQDKGTNISTSWKEGYLEGLNYALKLYIESKQQNL